MNSKIQPGGITSLLPHLFAGFPYEMYDKDNAFVKWSLSVAHKPTPMKDSQYCLPHNKHSVDVSLNDKEDD